jgi:hypothetical protein
MAEFIGGFNSWGGLQIPNQQICSGKRKHFYQSYSIPSRGIDYKLSLTPFGCRADQ